MNKIIWFVCFPDFSCWYRIPKVIWVSTTFFIVYMKLLIRNRIHFICMNWRPSDHWTFHNTYKCILVSFTIWKKWSLSFFSKIQRDVILSIQLNAFVWNFLQVALNLRYFVANRTNVWWCKKLSCSFKPTPVFIFCILQYLYVGHLKWCGSSR